MLGVFANYQPFPIVGFHVACAVRLRANQYLDAAASFRSRVLADGPSINEQHVWNVQVGTSTINWRESTALGVRGSLGYLKLEVTYQEFVDADEPWVEDDDSLYIEDAAFGRLRLGAHIALEAQLALRVGVKLNGEGLNGGVIGSTGLLVAF